MSARSPRSGSSRRGEAGFSLIECVVAVAVIALLSLVTLEVARLSRLGFERSVSASESLRDKQAAQSLLSALLERAQPIIVEDRRGRRATLFDGESDRLTFVAPYAAFNAPGARGAAALAARPGLALLSLRLEPVGDDGEALVLRHAPVLRAAERGSESLSQALLLAPAPANVSFRYFGSERDGERDEKAWREAWRLRARTPLAVSIAIESVGYSSDAPLVLPLGRSAPEGAF